MSEVKAFKKAVLVTGGDLRLSPNRVCSSAQGPILTVAHWSGQQPGLVGSLISMAPSSTQASPFTLSGASTLKIMPPATGFMRRFTQAALLTISATFSRSIPRRSVTRTLRQEPASHVTSSAQGPARRLRRGLHVHFQFCGAGPGHNPKGPSSATIQNLF